MGAFSEMRAMAADPQERLVAGAMIVVAVVSMTFLLRSHPDSPSGQAETSATAPAMPSESADPIQVSSSDSMEVWPGQFFADNRRHHVVLACPDAETVANFRTTAQTRPEYLDDAATVAIGWKVCHFRAARASDVSPVVQD